MIFRTLIKKGREHKVFCQDAIYTYQDKNFVVAAVFDGCSEVSDSHFASNLFVKILNKSTLRSVYQQPDFYEFVNLDLSIFFNNLINTKNDLWLELEDLTSTILICFYCKNTKQGVIYSFGDGFIQINNDAPIIINQDNHPNYLVKFWVELTAKNFILDDFLNKCAEKFTFNDLQNLVISTDGILTFKNLKDDSLSGDVAIGMLLNETNPKLLEQEVLLYKKHTILEAVQKWYHKDDLGIIRIINNEE